ncbi:hypothetical protein KFU94_08840 [Chloroflexi bacterium TSY]|nr:hypothetical protein [Chloroflexi bacterium TSY]
MSVGKRTVTITAFEKQLKLALKSFGSPEKLGKTSPLATYYFLGHVPFRSNGVTTERERGELLQQQIQLAGEALWGEHYPQSDIDMRAAIPEVRLEPGSRRYSSLVLELRVFRRYLRPRRLADIWETEDYLPGSRAEHYRDFDIAVKHLGEALLDRVRPTFRIEQPIAVARLVGYDLYLEQATQALQNGQTVSLNGPGGVGKTAVGATLARHGSFQSVFWFTIRPTLNDQLSSLLFSLAYFLSRHGASNLWQMVLSTEGKLDDFNLAFGLIQEDLAQISKYQPLLCFDELDRLYTGTMDAILPAHAQLLDFIESLRGSVPMLLIGQRPTVEADVYFELPGLVTPQIRQLITEAGIDLSIQQATQLYELTNGNPRLLVLCIALLQMGDSIEDLLISFPQSQALLPLLDRLWRRLDPGERRILQELSVFRSAAPQATWNDNLSDFNRLIQRRLVQQDGTGGVTLLPSFREAIYQELSTELREVLHLQAAEVRHANAEYTAAAYHYWQGGKDARAVQLWYPHREREIQRGQASAALTIFQGISSNRLGSAERKALGLIRAELNQLQGDVEGGLTVLEAEDWSAESELSIKASSLRGDFLRMLGHPNKALESYNEGQKIAARLLGMMASLHRKAGNHYLRNKEHNEARKEVEQIRYQADWLNGQIHEEEGRYREAAIDYQNALSIAEGLADQFRMAQMHRRLSNLYGRQHQFDQSIAHADHAMNYFDQVGDRLQLEMVRSDLLATLMHANQFDKVIETGHKSLAFYKATNYPFHIAIVASNLAEAYFNMNDVEKAEQYAREALDQEEPYIYPYALYTLGLVKQTQEDLDAAEQILHQTVHYAHSNEDPYVEAYARRALGKIYRDRTMQQEAQTALTKALQLFQRLGIQNEIAETEEELDAIVK